MLTKALILAIFFISLSTFPAPGQELVPLSPNGMLHPDATGIWENPDKGWRLILQQEGYSLYNYTSNLCVKDESLSEELSLLVNYFRRVEDVLTISMRSSNSTEYYFNRLNTLPETCVDQTNASPKQTFSYFSDVMETYYPFFDLYDVNWRKEISKHQQHVHDTMTDEALFEVLSNMLEGLKDGHIALLAEIEGEYKHYSPTRTRELGPNLDSLYYLQTKVKELGQFHTQWFRLNMKEVRKKVLRRKGQGSVSDDAIYWGRIGGVGYIRILGMEGYNEGDDFSVNNEIAGAQKAISEAIDALADTEALIVDIAFNRGGLDEVSLALASHFTEQRRLAYTKTAHNSSHPPQPIYLEPAEKNVYTKPIALLTSEITVSAAEIFTLAMRTLPHVTHYGEPTFGALSDILSKPLPNGWQLGISNERYIDAEGHFWEGRGIHPQATIKLFDPNNIYQSYPNALKKLAKQLEEATH